MHCYSVSNSMKAYCRLSPVFQSLMISQLFIFPNLLKINSRSCSKVTGLSLQTKSMFFGGSISASGRSLIISRTAFLYFVWCSSVFFLISSSVWFLSTSPISTSSSMYTIESESESARVAARVVTSPMFLTGLGDLEGMIYLNPAIPSSFSSSASSMITVCLILIF
mgnify:CR=1 FL=1